MDKVFILSCLLAGGAFVLSITAYARMLIKRKIIKLEDSSEAPELVSEKARVISKRTELRYNGSVKFPEHKMVFYAEFMVSGAETKEYEIDEKTYSEISEGDLKDLVTVNGEFYSFGNGETTE